MSALFTDDHRARAEQAQDYWLATVRPEVAGHLVPIWAVLVGDVFYMATERKAQKVKNLQAHPRAVLSLPDTRHPVIFEGTTELLQLPASAEVQATFQSKYNWNLNGAEGDYILVALTPDKIIAW